MLILFLILVTPYVVLTFADQWVDRVHIAPQTRARVGLSFFLAYTGIGHFVVPEALAQMLPPIVPYRIELIYITGILELLGAIGVWIPGLMRVTGLLLILMLVGVLPANIYSAFARVELGGHAAGPIYLLIRVPFQLFVILWTYFATDQHWVRRHPEVA